MVLLLLFLTIPLIGHAEFYDTYAPDDYLNYHRNDLYSNHKDSEDTEADKPNKIKYNDLLSLLHNDYSNKALLDHISNSHGLDNERLKKGDEKIRNMKLKVNITKAVEENNEEFKDHTRFAAKDWNRWKRNGPNDKEGFKAVLIEETHTNRLKRDIIQPSDKVTEKNSITEDEKQDLDILNHFYNKVVEGNDVAKGKERKFKKFHKKLNAVIKNQQQNTKKSDKTLDKLVKKDGLVKKYEEYLNEIDEKDFTNEILKSNSNKTRLKRNSALKLLKNMFHQSTVQPPTTKTVRPLTRQNHEVNLNNSLQYLVENLTETIKIFNENLLKLKLHLNDNTGFFMVKIPLNEHDGKKYLQNIHGHNNSRYIRYKRDVADLKSDELEHDPALNETEIHSSLTLQSNKSNNANISLDTKENTEATTILNATNTFIDGNDPTEPNIVSDSEVIKELNELKSKRDVNATNTEILRTNVTLNATEETFNITRRFNNEDIVVTKEQLNVTNELENDFDKSNDTETKLGSTRKLNSNKNDLIFFILKAYDDIKNLVAPMNYLKGKYSENVLYKIGYIISTLDTMDVSFKRMKAKILNNDFDANTKKLQRVYKKMMISKKLVQNVMEFLDNFVNSQLIDDVVK